MIQEQWNISIDNWKVENTRHDACIRCNSLSDGVRGANDGRVTDGLRSLQQSKLPMQVDHLQWLLWTNSSTCPNTGSDDP